jgi:uncharacterized membrane protein YsdA (DUF1294 family)/DNA-directed RNA polymerase subunit RPC12/RpoP
MGDETIRCIDCGRTFVWSYGEQRYYRARGLSRPKRCPDCRSQKRASRGAGSRPTSQRQRAPRRTNLVRQFGLIALGLAGALALILWLVFDVDALLSWLAAINWITFLVYGYDKASAGLQRLRVPERVLLALALIGGTMGAFAGMYLFRHKTSKESFRVRFTLILAAQVAMVTAYYVLVRAQGSG